LGVRKRFLSKAPLLSDLGLSSDTEFQAQVGAASPAGRDVILLAVSNPSTAAGLAMFAARIASRWGSQVVVLHVVHPGGEALARRPSPAEVRDRLPAVGAALSMLNQAGVASTWLVRESEEAGRSIREIAVKLHARLVVLGWRGQPDADGTRLDTTLQIVLQNPLWDVAVVGGKPPTDLDRILVPVGPGEHSSLALRLARDLAHVRQSGRTERGARVTALQVIPHETGTTDGPRVDKQMRRHGRDVDGDSLRWKVVFGDDPGLAILKEVREGYDTVVIGTAREALIDRLLFGDIPHQVAAGSNATVVVVRRHPGFLLWLTRRTWHGLVDLLPRLTPEEHALVHEKILSGSRSRVDFYTMIGLAAILASLGLLLNSPAVIIGAMLVAPLMSAIVGIGLGLIEGDTALISTAVGSTVRATLLAIALGALLCLLVPSASATPEILSRARPSLLDLAVALASGAAGAYALCRKNVSEALAGVAIAAALVPPLAAVGVGLALGRWDIAGGALLLFVTNLLAIAAAGGLVFLLLGFAPPATEKARRSTLGRGLLGTAMLLLAITVVLALLTAESLRAARLDQAIQASVASEVATVPGTELVQATSTVGSDGTLQLNVTVRSTRQFSYTEVLAMQKEIAAKLQRPVALLLTVIPAVRMNPLVPPTPTPTATPTATLAPTSTATPTPTSVSRSGLARPATDGATVIPNATPTQP
jgi:uncharacterized hydrophobic protein (TIGR00271 family)